MGCVLKVFTVSYRRNNSSPGRKLQFPRQEIAVSPAGNGSFLRREFQFPTGRNCRLLKDSLLNTAESYEKT